MGVAGAGMSMVGAYGAARSAQVEARTQAFIDELNAQQAEKGAQSSLQAGERQQQAILLHGAQVKSAQTASMAANGVDLSSPSAVNVLSSTDLMKQVDANTANANAVRSAWGYRVQETNYLNDARMKRATADAISPLFAAGTSLLGSATKVAGSWYAMKMAGAFPGGGSVNGGTSAGGYGDVGGFSFGGPSTANS
jgi:hypothetical protein